LTAWSFMGSASLIRY